MRLLTCAALLLLTAPLVTAPLLTVPLLAGPLPDPGTRTRRFPLLRFPRVSSPVLPPVSPSDAAARDLLRRMLLAENSLALSGDQVTLVTRGGLDISSEQLVQRRGAGALRIDYLRPARLAGEQIIDDGRFYCHLVPAHDTLELSPSRIQTLRVRVPEIIQQVRAGRLFVQLVGQDIVAGHACTIIQASARISGPVPYRKFWIDPANGAQLRIEQYDADGQMRSASYYTQVTYNPVFDKAAFRLPNAGGKVVTNGFAAPTLTLEQVRTQAGFSIAAPTYLPEGFRYQGGSASDLRGRRVIEQRYFNGANALSVFETPDTPESGPPTKQHPRRGVLFARQAGLKIVIIANLGNGELDKVLGSLR